MTRSRSADLEASNRITSMVAEVRTCVGRQWANRFVSKEERDLLMLFITASEEAAGRLVLRVGVELPAAQNGETVRPSLSEEVAA